MKKITALLTALTVAAALVSCGDTSTADNIIRQSESSAAETTAAPADTPAESSGEESEPEDYLSYVPPVEKKSYAEGIDAKNGDIDIDLTLLNPVMTYSQVYDMVMNPDLYKNKKIRARGTFAHTEENGKHYFAVLVKDATACCSQGIEFVLPGEHKFPDDYPPLDSEITVTGTFNSYKEKVYTYIQLLDAELTA